MKLGVADPKNACQPDQPLTLPGDVPRFDRSRAAGIVDPDIAYSLPRDMGWVKHPGYHRCARAVGATDEAVFGIMCSGSEHAFMFVGQKDGHDRRCCLYGVCRRCQAPFPSPEICRDEIERLH